MDAAIAAKISGEFLRAAFSSLDALLGSSHTFSASAAKSGDAAFLSRWCEQYPVWMHAQIVGGGAVALLWPMADAARLVAAVGGEDPAVKSSVTPADLAMLKELTDAVVGGGSSALSEMLGGPVQMLEAAASIGKAAGELGKLLGPAPSGIHVKFEAAAASGSVIFIFSQELEKRVAKRQDAGMTEGAVVSQAEVKDILTGFRPEHEPDRGGNGGHSGPFPENLDVIMDIELTATARMGRVEVPLSEVLNYGPGSIIELGHLVDEPVELLVNGKLIARGDVVVVDEKFGLRITEIVSPRERIESLR